VSKVRKGSREKFDATELFSDEDFDADNFVEQMDDRGHHQRSGPRTGWRRLEQLREEQQLRKELRDFADWEDFDGADY
jgi:hypothetical protein